MDSFWKYPIKVGLRCNINTGMGQNEGRKHFIGVGLRLYNC